MKILSEIIEAGFRVNLKSNGKLHFTYEGNDFDRPDTWQIKKMIREIRENREFAIQELKQIKSGELLDAFLPRNIRKTYIDDSGDN